MLPAFGLARASSVEEAVGLLSEDRVPYCGGTELLLAMKMGLLRPEALIDLKPIEELAWIERVNGEIVIGAGSRHAAVARHPLVRESLPLLVEVEEAVGNARVRAQGSIGGNLCFAEPKSDVATVLLALGASLTLASAAGRREVPMGDFIQGPYWTDRQPDELLVNVRVPIDATRRGVYRKYQTMERPTVGVALLDATAVAPYRLVVGAVSETPVAFDVEDLGDLDAEQVASGIDPVPDLTGSVRYKRHVTATYIRRAIAALTDGGGR